MDWDAKYRAGDIPWQRPALHPAFDHWFGGENGCRLKSLNILIPGCGTASEPVAFARLGANVTCLDLAPAAVEAQKRMMMKEGLPVTVLLTNILKWRPQKPVDMIYEQTCLCAVDPQERAEYERFAVESLKQAGSLYALFMQSEGIIGPPFHCELSDMRDVFPPSRWKWPETTPARFDHPKGMFELGFVLERT